MGFEGLAVDFAREALELLDELEPLLLGAEERGGAAADEAASLRRLLHTLKGNAALVGAAPLQQALHRLEDLAARPGPAELAQLLAAVPALRVEAQAIASGRSPEKASPALRRLGADGERSEAEADAPMLGEEVRVPRQRLDALLALAGELFVQRSALQRALHERQPSLAALRGCSERLAGSLGGLHEALLDLRLVPAGSLLERYRRLVRDESGRRGKKVRLQVEGGQVRADRQVLERLASPLMHLVRNAVAHGIEPGPARRDAGKPAEGVVTLAASLRGAVLELSVADDGAGLDREAVARRARERGLDASRAPEDLIFEAGLSTAALTDSAGRGVGLDVVRQAVARLGGGIQVASTPGKGTRFALRVPRSVAIERALLCGLSDEVYAVPMASILEASRAGEGRVRWLGRGAALEHGGSLLPLVDTGRLLGVFARRGDYALVLKAGARAALRVDAVLGQEDFVFQPLDPELGAGEAVTAAALLDDGRVVYRLDPDVLVSSAAGRA